MSVEGPKSESFENKSLRLKHVPSNLTNKEIVELLGGDDIVGIKSAHGGGGSMLFTISREVQSYLRGRFNRELHMSNIDEETGLHYLVINADYSDVDKELGMPISWMRERGTH